MSQAADGSVLATAAAADVVGDTPVLEAGDPPDLGGWADPRDPVRWAVHVDRPGPFRVSATTAWPARDGPPRTYTVQVTGEVAGDGTSLVVNGTVPRTASWQDYRTTDVGTVTLAGGDHVLTLRPDPGGPVGGGFMNLRSLALRPAAAGR